MWTIVALVLVASVEWSTKSIPGTTPPYGWVKFTVHDQLELLKSEFYPLVLILYVYSGVRHTTDLEQKRTQWNK